MSSDIYIPLNSEDIRIRINEEYDDGVQRLDLEMSRRTAIELELKEGALVSTDLCSKAFYVDSAMEEDDSTITATLFSGPFPSNLAEVEINGNYTELQDENECEFTLRMFAEDNSQLGYEGNGYEQLHLEQFKRGQLIQKEGELDTWKILQVEKLTINDKIEYVEIHAEIHEFYQDWLDQQAEKQYG